jgi:hypothetical protein
VVQDQVWQMTWGISVIGGIKALEHTGNRVKTPFKEHF